MKYIFYFLLFIGSSLFAQKGIDLNKVSEKNAIASFKELYDLLNLQNNAHFPEDIEKNVQWCESAFAKRGFTTMRLTTPAAPLLLAERKFKNAKKTVLIYLQIDGQPVNSAQWEQESPWKPTLKEKDEIGKYDFLWSLSNSF